MTDDTRAGLLLEYGDVDERRVRFRGVPDDFEEDGMRLPSHLYRPDGGTPFPERLDTPIRRFSRRIANQGLIGH